MVSDPILTKIERHHQMIRKGRYAWLYVRSALSFTDWFNFDLKVLFGCFELFQRGKN